MDSAAAAAAAATSTPKVYSKECIVIPPGKLKLKISFEKEIGKCVIKQILPGCPFGDQIQVEDRILEFDSKPIECYMDIQMAIGTRKYGEESTLLLETTRTDSTTKNGASIIKKKKSTTNRNDKTLKHFQIPLEVNNPKDVLIRKKILSELIYFNERHQIANEVNCPRAQVFESRVIRIPTQGYSTHAKARRRGGDNKMTEEEFMRYVKRNKTLAEYLEAFAMYGCNNDQDHAANLMCSYFAKKFPSEYTKHKEVAERYHKQKVEADAIASSVGKAVAVLKKKQPLPPGFINHDGTDDMEWNIRYSELLKYKEEHGDCLVPTNTGGELGTWVRTLRYNYKHKRSVVNPIRKQLLDNIGFVWVVNPQRTQFGRGGEPRYCKALAAKLSFGPKLSFREALLVGGFTEEDLDVIVDPVHTWRTEFHAQKTKLKRGLKRYDTYDEKRSSVNGIGTIREYMNILSSTVEDRLEQVFGEENSSMLLDFLAAEEEKSDGEEEDEEENDDQEDDDDEIEDEEQDDKKEDEENTKKKVFSPKKRKRGEDKLSTSGSFSDDGNKSGEDDGDETELEDESTTRKKRRGDDRSTFDQSSDDDGNDAHNNNGVDDADENLRRAAAIGERQTTSTTSGEGMRAEIFENDVVQQLNNEKDDVAPFNMDLNKWGSW